MYTKFGWTRVTESEFERLLERCNFTEMEQRIFEMRRKGKSLELIAYEVGYSVRQIKNISAVIVKKITKES